MPLENDTATNPAGASGGEQSSAQSTVVANGDAAQNNSTASPGSTATPSPASPQGESGGGDAGKTEAAPKSALDAVLKAIGKAPAGQQAGETKPGEKAEPVTEAEHNAAGEGEKDWIDRETYGKLPPVVRRRIGNLTTQRNEARDAFKAAEPKMKVHDDLVTYCKSNRVSQDDFSYALRVMSLVRTDPVKAWQELQPLINDLRGHVGEVLPADLQKEVEAGTLSEPRAKELAANRRERSRLEDNTQQRDAEATAEREHIAAQKNITDITTALKGWEQRWSASDPDYKKKSQRVWERMVTMIQGKTLTPQQAVEIAEQAKKDVEEWLKGVLPPKHEIRPPVPNGVAAGTKKQPSSALEAAKMAVNATRAAA